MLIIIVIMKIKINYFYNKVSDDDDGSPYEDNKNEVGFCNGCYGDYHE